MQSSTRIALLLTALAGTVGLYLWIRSRDQASAGDSVDSAGAAAGSALDALSTWAETMQSRVVNAVSSRGYRNNNPGNLRYIAVNPWNGQVANDNGYAVYDTPENGTRALGHQLLAYYNRGLRSVTQIISTWAPPSDGNNTAAYIADVADQLGIDPDAPFDVPNTLPELTAAIAKHENGYLDSAYDWTWSLAA